MQKIKNTDTSDHKLELFDMLNSEANTVRDNDKILIRSMFRNFYGKKLNVGIGFQRAYGSILSGDYFDLIKLPDGNYLFVFADVSGHGLPAYTTLIRLRSAITIAVNDMKLIYKSSGIFDADYLIKHITSIFTSIMEAVKSDDFASVNFTFISNEEKGFRLRFYSRGMLFPMILRRNGTRPNEIINLNKNSENWKPNKGFLLCRNIEILLGDIYYETPLSDFIMQEGDSILYFSDGILEACHNESSSDEFGENRIEESFRDHGKLPPQAAVNLIFQSVYEYIGVPQMQKDDMTAVLIDFPQMTD